MISVSFSGTAYQLPEDREESWPELTDYLVALSTAATTTSMFYSSRIATSSSVSVLDTDTIVLVNVGGAATATLPAVDPGRFIGIYDLSGAGETYNIVISCSSGQTINGVSTYTIQSNYGGVLLQWNGVTWQIISEANLGVLFRNIKRRNNATNLSFVQGGETATTAFPTVTNGQSCSFDITGTKFFRFYISLSTGEAIQCVCNQASADISAVSDVSAMFLTTDAGVGIFVSKTAADNTITVKNRLGVSAAIEIHTETGIISPTAWS